MRQTLVTAMLACLFFAGLDQAGAAEDQPAPAPPIRTDALYVARGDAGRAEPVPDLGGTAETQAAIARALDWLAKTQQENGSWQGTAAHTGMALITFMAAGIGPLSEPHGETVHRALLWLSQWTMDPDNAKDMQNPYITGIVTWALAESYAMYHIPVLKSPMEQGLARIVAGQQPGGGFDYHYDKGERWDLCITGWQVRAMTAGLVAQAETPGLALACDKAAAFIRTTAYKNRKFGYAVPGSGGNMTGVGTHSLQLLGQGDSEEVRAAMQTLLRERLELYRAFLAGKRDWNKDAGRNIYGWEYDTTAIAFGDPADWDTWCAVYIPVLLKAQNPKGYWAVEKGHGMDDANDAGRLLSTAWCTLQLEALAPNPYLPSYRHLAKVQAEKAAGTYLPVEPSAVPPLAE